MSILSFLRDFRIILYFLLTIIVLIGSFFPEGLLFYCYLEQNPEFIHYLLAPLYFFLTYCLTVVIFGVIHSQLVVRLTLPFKLKPGIYSHHSSEGRLVAIRITADGIFKSMLKVFTFLPFLWGMILFPYGLRLYGLKCGKKVHIATKTYVETAGLVSIGDNSFIGYNSIVTGHANENRAIEVLPTRIGRNVLVGTCSIVAPGVEIGDNSVIGAKSALLKQQKVGSNEIWIGVPAKFLRKRRDHQKEIDKNKEKFQI